MAVARLELPLGGHHALYWLTGRDGEVGPTARALPGRCEAGHHG
jgi:hypothetical protein